MIQKLVGRSLFVWKLRQPGSDTLLCLHKIQRRCKKLSTNMPLVCRRQNSTYVTKNPSGGKFVHRWQLVCKLTGVGGINKCYLILSFITIITLANAFLRSYNNYASTPGNDAEYTPLQYYQFAKQQVILPRQSSVLLSTISLASLAGSPLSSSPQSIRARPLSFSPYSILARPLSFSPPLFPLPRWLVVLCPSLPSLFSLVLCPSPHSFPCLVGGQSCVLLSPVYSCSSSVLLLLIPLVDRFFSVLYVR